MIDFNAFDRGVIGKKLPSDSTLKNMRKAELIELLHIAEHNYKVLSEVYQNAVDTNKCNRCPLPNMNAEHDKQIRAEVIEEFCEGYKKFQPNGIYCKTQEDCIETDGWCIDCYKKHWLKEQNNEKH